MLSPSEIESLSIVPALGRLAVVAGLRKSVGPLGSVAAAALLVRPDTKPRSLHAEVGHLPNTNMRRFVLTELARGVENPPSVTAHDGVEKRWRIWIELPPLWTGLLDTDSAKRSITMALLLAIVLVGIGVAVYLWLHWRL